MPTSQTTCYVVSHERSGTHFLIDSIRRNLPAFSGFYNIGEWFGPYDETTVRDSALASARDEFPSRIGVIKTHADRDLFEAAYAPAPVVYIVRDPRDVMVSWWHYLNNPVYYANNPAVPPHGRAAVGDFLRQPITPFLRFSYSRGGRFNDVVERWCDHVNGWLGTSAHLHIVSYELLSSHFDRTFAGIARFLNQPIPASLTRPTLADGSGHLSRRGEIGDWRNWLSAEDEDFIVAAVVRSGLESILHSEDRNMAHASPAGSGHPAC